jgi:hypothetical protein
VKYPPNPIAGCPYCPCEAPTLGFCTTNQLRFLQAFVNQTLDAPEGETIIDLDVLADALEANEQRWVYTEETQQHKLTCADCKMTFDILGECAASRSFTRLIASDSLLLWLDSLIGRPFR